MITLVCRLSPAHILREGYSGAFSIEQLLGEFNCGLAVPFVNGNISKDTTDMTDTT